MQSDRPTTTEDLSEFRELGRAAFFRPGRDDPMPTMTEKQLEAFEDGWNDAHAEIYNL